MSDEAKSVTITKDGNGNATTATADNAVTRRDSVERPARTASPFTMMRRMAEDMDRLFDDWQFGRGWLRPIFGDDPISKRLDEFGQGMYLPDIEAFEKDGQFIVRADLPGIRKEDVSVDVSDRSITIRGERRQMEKEVHKGYYRSERNYGSFYRSVPLPATVDANAVKASMNDGVLEITMPVGEANTTRVQID